MRDTYIEMARRLLALPGVRLKFDAQYDLNRYVGGLSRGDTQFESCALHDPTAETFTHYLVCSDDLSTDDEMDLSYYNAESWGEETATLGEQIRLVRERFPDQDIHIVTGA